MEAKIIESSPSSITIQVTVSLGKEMLTTEESIQQAVNQAGFTGDSTCVISI